MYRTYLDNNATTKLDPAVIEVMQEHLNTFVANPSSIHFFGQQARNILQSARNTIASYLSVKPHEIIFTSGGTESLTTLLKSAFTKSCKGHIITSTIEHAAIYETVRFLEAQGCRVSYIKPEPSGSIDPQKVAAEIQEDTKYIVISAANNETGVKNDLSAIAQIASARNIPFFVDAIALFGKEPFSIPKGVSAVAFSGHKIHGPKGIGFTFIRSDLQTSPLLIGGGQEYGKRSGTENLLGIVGLAKAVELLNQELPQATVYMETLRNRLEQGLLELIPNAQINGSGSRVANTTNITFPNIDGESLLIQLDMAGIAASHGSACSSGAIEPSRVLLQMGLSRSLAKSAIRFSISRFTSLEEVESTIAAIAQIVKKFPVEAI